MKHRNFRTAGSALALLILLWLGTAGVVRAQTAETEEPWQDYVVQAGDSLLALASAYNTSVTQLKAANQLDEDDNLLYTGQVIRVPAVEPPVLECAEEHTVQPGESLWSIAATYATTVAELAAINRIDNPRLIAVGQLLCLAVQEAAADTGPTAGDGATLPWGQRPVDGFWYTVNQGDTLAWIGARYGISETALRAANALADAADAELNQLLWIPGLGPATGPSAARPWAARYHDGSDLEGPPLLERYESEIGYFWRAGSPHASVPVDSFSAIWTGEFGFDSDAYRFVGVADHGIRIYVDDDLILDNWQPQPQSALYADISMTAGTYTVRVEYREVTGNALVFVAWHAVPATAVK